MRHLLGFRGHANTTIAPAELPSDVTPNAVNWANVGFDSGVEKYVYSSRQITGINQTITLKVEYSSDFTDLYYAVTNTQPEITQDYAVFSPPNETSNPVMTYILPNGTFTVSNNQYVTFGADTGTPSVLVTVKNTSDGNATLDTFLADIT
jgi:hypothetical protein